MDLTPLPDPVWTDPSFIATKRFPNKNTLGNHDNHLHRHREEGEFRPVFAFTNLGLHCSDGLILDHGIHLVEETTKVAPE